MIKAALVALALALPLAACNSGTSSVSASNGETCTAAFHKLKAAGNASTDAEAQALVDACASLADLKKAIVADSSLNPKDSEASYERAGANLAADELAPQVRQAVCKTLHGALCR